MIEAVSRPYQARDGLRQPWIATTELIPSRLVTWGQQQLTRAILCVSSYRQRLAATTTLAENALTRIGLVWKLGRPASRTRLSTEIWGACVLAVRNVGSVNACLALSLSIQQLYIELARDNSVV